MTLRDLPLLISVTKAAELLGMGRTQCYEAVKAGDIETVTVNNRLWVQTAPLLEKVGVRQ